MGTSARERGGDHRHAEFSLLKAAQGHGDIGTAKQILAILAFSEWWNKGDIAILLKVSVENPVMDLRLFSTRPARFKA